LQWRSGALPERADYKSSDRWLAPPSELPGVCIGVMRALTPMLLDRQERLAPTRHRFWFPI